RRPLDGEGPEESGLLPRALTARARLPRPQRELRLAAGRGWNGRVRRLLPPPRRDEVNRISDLKMHRFPRVAGALALVLGLVPSAVRAADPKPDAVNAQLERIFAKKEFEAKTFGPYEWMEGGKAYTTLEPSPSVPEAKDLVRYDTATGARRVLVPASTLVGADGKPLEVEGYSWSNDGKRLLVFANAKRVWRRKTRGDYWVLDVAS